MESNCSAQTYFAFVAARRTPRSLTNLMATPAMLQGWVEDGADIRIGEGAAVILQPDTEHILRLFFFARDGEAVREIPDLIPKTDWDVVCEVTGRDDKTAGVTQALQDAGFRAYARFQRMLLKPICRLDMPGLDRVEHAVPEDAEEILDITYAAFDRITAHIHSREALRGLILAGEVLVIRQEGRIAGFTIFDSSRGRVMLVDHVITRPEYRGQKVARRLLMKKLMEMPQVESCILWINELCTGPIAYHVSNGFQVDGTYCNIFTL